MSIRNIALALGLSRRKLSIGLDLAAISKEEFEALVESDDFEVAELKRLARSRANKSIWYERRCPHCGGLLGIEGQS